MKNITNALGFDSSDKAKFRLRCIEILDKHGFKVLKDTFPYVSKASVYRWRKQYYDSDKKLESLVPLSTKPHHVRQMQIPAKILIFIKLMRLKYPRLSKYKLKPLLDLYAAENGLPTYSASWIGKVIKKYNFFFNHGRKPVVKRRNNKYKYKQRIKRCPKAKNIKLGYLQLDAIVIYYMGQRLNYLTAIEIKTRQVFVKRVASISSRTTTMFLKEIINQVPYPIHTIQTDNGSEFEAVFRQSLKQLGIKQLNSYPKQPQTQGYVEKFNHTLQDECLYYHLDKALDNIKELDKSVNQWLDWYHNQRPHQGLSYQTPQQVLQQELKTLTPKDKAAIIKLKRKAQSLKCV